ncbi:velvet factor-domain-containing protein [Armillaria novae-zelandiae]|uniref:Velvet factor-domain-containing protein n=1 Tax=Armillaria novae-zelandiae TaxID=153914 RepID=A0AA39PJL1_9AGAR|nr:velvet factor-domain-containing protein [Armillaria novae-zelandiae]
MTSLPRGTGLIGQPIPYSSGQYRGFTMRTQVKELQKAVLGRKYANVDRRPLDPPPVISMSLYTVRDAGTSRQHEEEIEDYSEVQTAGLMCTVDLFPVTPPSPEHPLADIVHRDLHTGIPILESSKMTTSLVGATFVQPNLIDWEGKRQLMFVFSDLAVRQEGQFLLRYRVFDLFARAHGQSDLTIQAECFGGVFRVYSTKEFPGLPPSTELTKHIQRYGVRLNARETERKRRKPSERPPEDAGQSKKRKHEDGSDAEVYENDSGG